MKHEYHKRGSEEVQLFLLRLEIQVNIWCGDNKVFKIYLRNDIDTVGVKAGCTFTGFSGSSFDGTKMSISAVLVEK